MTRNKNNFKVGKHCRTDHNAKINNRGTNTDIEFTVIPDQDQQYTYATQNKILIAQTKLRRRHILTILRL